MTRITLTILSFMLLSFYTVFSYANDTVGAEAAGGIEFKKTEDISMEKEILTLSADKVRVEYEFLNKTKKTITERIYFPMPFRGSYDLSCYGRPGQLQNFKVWANGRLINATWTVQAKLPSGEDVTSKLKRLGLSDQDIASYAGVTILCEGDADDPSLVAQHNKDLDRLGIKDVDQYGVNEEWNVSHVYHWDQEFPPEKITKIVHEYTPFTGGSSGGLDFSNSSGAIKSAKRLENRVGESGSLCIEDNVLRAAKNTIKNGYLYRYATVRYVLTTGRNWSGPIKDFTLNIKKQDPRDLVSLCFDGSIKKASPLVLTSHLTNFVPQDDLHVLFLLFERIDNY